MKKYKTFIIFFLSIICIVMCIPNKIFALGTMMDQASDFLNKGTGSVISDGDLKTYSSQIFNMLLSIAMFLAVAIGMYLGIKFIVSSAEEKAKVKESLVPYFAGCAIIFGAFGIWKLVVTIFKVLV